MKHLFKNSRAFTLAEVLITLGIIGVVASMTIPTLMSHNEKVTTATRLKQTYAQLQAAIKMSEVENSDAENWTYTGAQRTYVSEKDFADRYLVPYLRVAKTEQALADYTITFLNDSAFSFSEYYKIFLANGVIINVVTYDTSMYIHFYVDVNGTKKPNKIGKDVFLLAINKNGKLYAHGETVSDRAALLDASNGSNCNKTKEGGRCTRLIMLDNWEIKDDYPW